MASLGFRDPSAWLVAPGLRQGLVSYQTSLHCVLTVEQSKTGIKVTSRICTSHGVMTVQVLQNLEKGVCLQAHANSVKALQVLQKHAKIKNSSRHTGNMEGDGPRPPPLYRRREKKMKVIFDES